MIEQLQMRIKEIESAIEKSTMNHNGLMVRLDEAKYFLDMATKFSDAVAPDSAVTSVLDVIDHVVDAVE
jgi:hypothetical protein